LLLGINIFLRVVIRSVAGVVGCGRRWRFLGKRWRLIIAGGQGVLLPIVHPHLVLPVLLFTVS
jgi:hypothetical protein